MKARVSIAGATRSRPFAVLCALAALLATGALSAWSASEAAAKSGSGRGGVKLNRIGSFDNPVYVDAAPGVNGVFVVEQPGRIVLVVNGKRSTFLDIRGQVQFGGEQGLLSVAFPNDYASSGLFYVYYVTQGGDLAIEEYRRAAPKRADPASARRLVTVSHPGESNHNGGQLQFGPDGGLYAGTGDGGGGGDPDNSAQDPNSQLGKILRIDPNPGGTAATSIVALGLRNPFRFSFDTVSSRQPRIIIGDVGQDNFEEINYETLASLNGANFGWNDFEGNSVFAGGNPPGPSRHDRPIKVYPTGGQFCSVIGGYVVRDSSLRTLRGRYVYGDFCSGKLRSFVPTLGGARKDRPLGVEVESISSFGEGPNGSLYATSLNGAVSRLVARGAATKK